MKAILEKKKQEVTGHLKMNQEKLAQLESQVAQTKESMIMIYGALQVIEELIKENELIVGSDNQTMADIDEKKD
jgi:predicted SpoU family rRNA methylase